MNLHFTPLAIGDNLNNFIDYVHKAFDAILAILTNLGTSVFMLMKMAIGFLGVAPILSTYFLAPIAISGFIMVVVGLVKLIFGRQSQ